MNTKNKNKEEVLIMENEEKGLSYLKNSKEYKEEYKNLYEQIHFHEEEPFLKEVNTFLDLQYTPNEINDIYAYGSRKNIEKMLHQKKIDIKKYYPIHNFEVDKISRYEEYQSKTHCSLEEAVLKVNIGLDHDFYTQIECIENKDAFTVLVNKYRSLGEYEPNDLISLNYDAKYQLRKEAGKAFENLVESAKLEDVFIKPYSAYRSYDYQTSLYNKYVNRDGKEIADTYSARPGHSEHQTGLTVDVWSEGYTEIKEKDAKWLQENSYKYGFIVRYTKENKSITGYIEEPWHLRYLGCEIAKGVYNSGLSYDEYYDLYIK